MTLLEHLSPEQVGERLRIAREAKKLKQAEVAERLGIARTTVVAIEQGQRKARIDEVQQLAKLYGVSTNELLREEAIHADLTPKFRKLFSNQDDAAEAAAKLLSDLARAEAELENILGVRRQRNYPPERPILPGDVRAQAEQDAAELRQSLGLGFNPVTDIITLLELELGVRVYIREFDGRIQASSFTTMRSVRVCSSMQSTRKSAVRKPPHMRWRTSFQRGVRLNFSKNEITRAAVKSDMRRCLPVRF